MTWNGNEAFITKSIPNDTVFLKMNISGNDYDTKMYFDEVNGETTVGWKVKGNLSFSEKFKLFFQGTPESMIAPIFEEGLAKIDKILQKVLKNLRLKMKVLQ